jgi:hypothetical protein
LNRFLKEILLVLLKELEKSYKLGQTITIDLGMFIVYLELPKFVLNNISYSEEGTGVDLFDKNNTLGLHIEDSNLNVSLQYNMILDPPILDDQGILEIGYSALDIDVIVGMQPQKDNPQRIDLYIAKSNFTVDPKDVYIELTNNNDFNKILINIMGAIKGPIINLVTSALTDYFQNVVDLVESLIPETIDLDGVVIDISLFRIPDVTTDDFLTVSWVGKVVCPGCEYKNTRRLPTYFPEGKDMQLFISDYTMKSALCAVVVKDLLKFTVSYNETNLLNTYYLKDLIPELAKKFGNNKPCKIDFSANKQEIPDLQITTNGVNFKISLNLDFEVQPDPEKDFEQAFTFVIDTTVNARLNIDSGLKLIMDIKNLNIEVVKVVDSQIGDIQIKTLNDLMHGLLTVIKTVGNLLLSKGLNLGKFIKNIPVYLKDIQAIAYDGYYGIQANPYFQVEEFSNMLQNKMFESDEDLSNLFSSHMIKDGVKKGILDAYRYFDIDYHLEKLGMKEIVSDGTD